MGANNKAAATYHPGTGPDARVEAVAGDMERDWEYLYGGRLGYAQHLLASADQADREAGFHRVRVDDATVEKAARALFEVRDDPYDDDEWEDLTSSDRELYECQARAVLAAITEAES